MKKVILTFAAMTMALALYAQTQQVRVFSHRGGRMERDENTLLAFQQSWDNGYTGFETDVRMSRDGVLYIMHDHTIHRTTNGHGILEEMDSKEIDKLLTKKGNPVLRFDDLCAFFDGKDSLYIEWELKSKPVELYPEERLKEYVEKIYKGVKKIKTMGSQMVFTSSDYRGLRYLQMNHPEAELLLISSRPICDETIRLARTTGIMTLGCTMDGTTREAVAKAHREGITVSLWPGKSVDDFILGVYLGADRLCTDVPVTVKQFAETNLPWINAKY